MNMDFFDTKLVNKMNRKKIKNLATDFTDFAQINTDFFDRDFKKR